MDTMQIAWQSGKTVTVAESFVPKTVQELKNLCATRPDHPTAIDIMNAIKELPDDAVSYVLPISIAAIEENRLVEVIYEMKTVASPTDGGQTSKKVRHFRLGPSLDSRQEVPTA
ncbi:MAG: hypothetical protein IJK97_00820 [Thermoguttaceae bacterium]|nr:hypothetical protein [Thermoguttaceae bacterium]MBR0190451.1 hypothetical protein [Thermoguttaceae bacterium]